MNTVKKSKANLVDINSLKTIQNFAVSFGEAQRGKKFSTQYIYKLLKEGQEGKRLPFHKIEIDGVQFIQNLKHAR